MPAVLGVLSFMEETLVLFRRVQCLQVVVFSWASAWELAVFSMLPKQILSSCLQPGVHLTGPSELLANEKHRNRQSLLSL
jgi:hypothetical protein